ncbi:hypothetical protein WMY93_011368 [Mugilogobius chulae]|uniref:DNA-directed DNA polymerase n=1 Tax=Mugilogobius chulae TaxID=88201 RepID=A0AAW0PB63_9GOBI
MDKVLPFVEMFPNIYPTHRPVNMQVEQDLVGVMIKSVMFSRAEEALLCRGLIVDGQNVSIHTTVYLKVVNISPIVGYDLELVHDQDHLQENWESVQKTWFSHITCEPVHVEVQHEDIKRTVSAMVFPLKSIGDAARFIQNVKGALTFGDFCPSRGYYMDRDGNTPALYSGVMFGRVYFVPRNKLNGKLRPCDLVYDHDRSELEAQQFEDKHMCHFYKAACLDIETVSNNSHRDPSLRCTSFAYRVPYCTEEMVNEMTAYRTRLVQALNTGKKKLPKQAKNVTIPSLPPDMPGQQHEITCLSLVIINSHLPKLSRTHHRKKLIVLFNKFKVNSYEKCCTQTDPELAARVGIDDVTRIQIHPCSGELGLLEQMVKLLDHHEIELLYVYNAEFDIRVIEQRVHFYAQSNYTEDKDEMTKIRCTSLLQAWCGLFVTRALSENVTAKLQFEQPQYLQMYMEMIKKVGSVLFSGDLTESKLRVISTHIEKFNKEKSKIGHFKMNSCGMNIIDLYRMTGSRETKFACKSRKLNDVAPFIISRIRDLNRRPPKDARKMHKVADVHISDMDTMIRRGGGSLFAVLVYNLVDSQLCARLAKVLKPVASLFHRCRMTLNCDVLIHGRGTLSGGSCKVFILSSFLSSSSHLTI